MIAQENIWRDMRRASRIIGAILTIVGGLVIAFQGFLADMLPPADGFVRVNAVVTTLEERGTFREPAFSVTLAYTVSHPDGETVEFRSGRRVDFLAYNALAKGDIVRIDYNPADPYEWRLTQNFETGKLNDYALGLLMILLGAFSLIFPTIARLASREDDFSQLEKISEDKGQNPTYYDKIAQR
jgi:hypothetical protein